MPRPVAAARSVAAGAFARTEGSVRLLLQVARLRAEQRADDAAQAEAGPRLRGRCRRAIWEPGEQGRPRPQAAHRACGEPHRARPIQHGAHGERRAALRHRGGEARGAARTSERANCSRRPSARRSTSRSAASATPNGVTEAIFARLRQHWSEEQIVEIVGIVAMAGFLSRWNVTMATPLEAGAAGDRRQASRAARLERRRAPALARLSHRIR